MWHNYPYTDLHELNLDYILAKIKEFQTELIEFDTKILDDAKKYTDEQITLRLADIESRYIEFVQDVRNEIEHIQSDINNFKIEIKSDFNNFVALVNARLTFTDNLIKALNDKVDAYLIISRTYTDEKVAQNNETIIEQLEGSLGNIKIINFFTGERIGVQAMFDYLASLHIDDGIDYDALASRNKTINDMIAFNKNYTDLIIHGNSIII